jgi:hypothetical protein
MASPELSSPGAEAGTEAAESPNVALEPSESAKTGLTKLITEVAARYSGVIPAAELVELQPDVPQSEAVVWQQGGAGFLPEESDEISHADSGDESREREQKLAREIELLRKALEAQQKATQRAEKNTAALSQKLISTQAQIEKTQKQVHGGQRARIERAESSVYEMKAEMERTQRNLETERRARRAEAVAAKALLAEAEKDRSSAVAARVVVTSRMPTQLQVRLGLAAAASFAAVGAMLLYWGFGPSRARLTAAQPAASQAVAALPRAIQPVAPIKDSTGSVTTTTAEKKGDFTESMDRLNKALSQFPGLSPEEVLRQISLTKSASECAFHWNNGNPALIYTGGQISMAQVLDRCALAVEKFR